MRLPRAFRSCGLAVIGVGAIFGSAVVHADCTPANNLVAPHTRGSWSQGGIVYDTSTDELKTCDGTNYNTVGGSGGGDQWISSTTSYYDTQTPTMTDYTTAGVTMSASSELDANRAAWRAGDGIVASGDGNKVWCSTAGQTGWLQVDFGSGSSIAIDTYKLTAGVSGWSHNTHAPKTWTFQGSNNGSSWTTLDTRTNVAAWSANEERTYSFSNSTAYRYYRLNVTATGSGSYILVAEMVLIGASPKPSLYTSDISTFVGIGITSPSHLLHVNGIARSTQSSWATSSDVRVKKNIVTLDDGLATLMRVRPVSFEYVDAYKAGKQGMDGTMRGFIAQEVEEVVPDMVQKVDEKFGDKEISDFRVLNSSGFTPILVRAIQEIKEENDSLRRDLDALKRNLGR